MRLPLAALALFSVACISLQAGAMTASLRTFAAGATDSGLAARQAAAMTGGRVLDVQTESAGGRQVYVVKVLLEDGRVKIVRIDGSSGNAVRR